MRLTIIRSVMESRSQLFTNLCVRIKMVLDCLGGFRMHTVTKFVLTVILLVLGCNMLFETKAEIAPEAIITMLEGEIDITSKAGVTKSYASPLNQELLLYIGDHVQVGTDSSVEFMLSDGSVVLAESGAALIIKTSAIQTVEEADDDHEIEESNISLLVGRIWVYVVETLQRLRPFTIETPAAIAGVRGTIFTLEVSDSGDTLLSVDSGLVDLISQNVVEPVAGGYQASVSYGQPPTTSKQIQQAERDRWRAKQWWSEQIRHYKTEPNSSRSSSNNYVSNLNQVQEQIRGQLKRDKYQGGNSGEN